MVAISRPSTDWPERILEVAKRFMNAKVCFYEETEATTPYNPVTGEGGAAGIRIIWRGHARVQHLRAPREFATAYQAKATRFFRFQIDPNETWNGEGVPFLPQGVKARVIAGGRDSDLESLAFVTISATNSSHKAVRTVELSSNMTSVVWQWNPDSPGGD